VGPRVLGPTFLEHVSSHQVKKKQEKKDERRKKKEERRKMTGTKKIPRRKNLEAL